MRSEINIKKEETVLGALHKLSTLGREEAIHFVGRDSQRCPRKIWIFDILSSLVRHYYGSAL